VKVILGLTPVAAIAILGLTALPAAAWHHPAVDTRITAVDPNLIYTSRPDAVSSSMVTISATGRFAQPEVSVVTLVATPMQAFETSFDVSLRPADPGNVPLRVGIWSPWTATGYFLQFLSTGNAVETQTVLEGHVGETLSGGVVVRTAALGFYIPDRSYHISLVINKARAITIQVSGQGLAAQDSVQAVGLSLAANTRIALTASTHATQGTVQASITSYRLVLPHQGYWANKVDDRRELGAVIGLLVIGIVMVAIGLGSWAKPIARNGKGWTNVRREIARLRPAAPRPKHIGLLVATCAIYLGGNCLLFPLGGHPFDMGNERLYAYVAGAYGPAQLYYIPNVVSLARIWGGVPYVEAAFPYEPVIAYVFAGIGWLHSAAFSSGNTLVRDSVALEYLIKGVNVAFGLVDSVMIYWIMRVIGSSIRRSIVSAGLFLFNPAVWFSMSVWGQTHVISLFFVLAVVLLAERQSPTLAWLALAAGCLTRPQILVFGLLLGIVLIRKFPLRINVMALSWTIIVTFLALAPLTLATSASLPVDVLLNNVNIQEAGGNIAALTTVSQDAYSVWPLVTYLAHGASGLERAFTPSSASLVDGITYLRLGQVLTLATLLAVGVALARSGRVANTPGAYLSFVALGMASFLMLLTGVVATHFLLALPFIILSRRFMSGGAYTFVVAVWTVTTLVPMVGDMGNVTAALDYPLFAPARNPVTKFFVDLYGWDRFITAATVANICAVIWLAVSSRRPAGAAARPQSVAL
jgi:hypothetical protein